MHSEGSGVGIVDPIDGGIPFYHESHLPMNYSTFSVPLMFEYKLPIHYGATISSTLGNQLEHSNFTNGFKLVIASCQPLRGIRRCHRLCEGAGQLAMTSLNPFVNLECSSWFPRV